MSTLDTSLTNLLGTGPIFPVELNGGAPVMRSGYSLIESSLKIILAYHLGKRFFRGEFGSNLNLILEEPNDTVLRALVEQFVRDSISRWEKRITLNKTTLIQDNEILSIRLDYRINQTRLEDTFIYPFYTKVS